VITQLELAKSNVSVSVFVPFGAHIARGPPPPAPLLTALELCDELLIALELCDELLTALELCEELLTALELCDELLA
jgi:hypothetical protein